MKKRIFLVILTSIFFLLLLVACFACNKDDGDFIEGVNHYKLNITISDDLKRVKIEEIVTINNNSGETWDILPFRIYANSYKEDAKMPAYFGSLKEYGGITINSVMQNGAVLAYTIDETLLNVNLKESLKSGEQTEIFIDAEVFVPSCNLRLGLYENMLNFGNAYPVLAAFQNGNFRLDDYTKIGDPFITEIADYEIVLNCNKSVTVAMSAEQTREIKEENTKTIYASDKNLRDFAFVASYKFNIIKTNSNDTEILYYYLGEVKPSKLLTTAKNVMDIFGEMLTQYPYKTFSVVETNFYYGGMEYSNLVYINRSLSDKESVVVHETLHQWFGIMVGSDAINAAWLDEALVTFLTDYYYLKLDNSSKFSALRNKASNDYKSYINPLKEESSEFKMNFIKSLYQFESSKEYSMSVYTRGSMMFDAFYNFTGRKKFENSLRTYFIENQFKFASKDTLLNAFKKNRIDITPVYENFVNDTVMTFKFS